MTTSRRPGDALIEKFMPDASPEERERAHANLRQLARVLLRIAKRQVDEEIAAQRDSQKTTEGDTISA